MPWEKGKSGNPGGRPKANKEIQALAREHSPEAISRLAHWMRQQKDPGASIKAAIVLLERAWGKPAQAVEHTGADGGAIEVKQISDTEAARLIAFTMSKALESGEIEGAPPDETLQ